MKIAVFFNFPDEILNALKTRLPDHEIIQTSYENLEKDKEFLKEARVIIGHRITKELLAITEKLELFQLPWVGTDLLNFELLKDTHITLCNTHWNDRIVAEHAVALLLACAKRLLEVDTDFRKGHWESRGWKSIQLRNATVLLLGYGPIGKQIAKLLTPFDMQIYALRQNPAKTTEEEKELVHKVISWDEYPEIAPHADFVIAVLPLTPVTENILNKERLLMIKKGAYLINVGRGKTIDEKALYDVLSSHHLAGAGIDVWYNYKSAKDNEPFYPSKYPFHELSNVILSPHRSASFSDVPELVWNDLVDNIRALEKGQPLKNVISIEKRY